MNKQKIWLITTIIIALLIIGGIYFWQNSKSTKNSLQKEISSPQNQVDESKETNQSTANDSSTTKPPTENINNQPEKETEDWKNYYNPEYGLKFKYPKNMKIKDISEKIDEKTSYNGVILSTDKLKIDLSIANTDDAYNLYNGTAPTKQISKNDKVIGNLDTEKLVEFGYQILPNGTWVLSYTFNNQGEKYKFSTSADGTEGTNPISKETENLMEQILATFSFVK